MPSPCRPSIPAGGAGAGWNASTPTRPERIGVDPLHPGSTVSAPSLVVTHCVTTGGGRSRSSDGLPWRGIVTSGGGGRLAGFSPRSAGPSRHGGRKRRRRVHGERTPQAGGPWDPLAREVNSYQLWLGMRLWWAAGPHLGPPAGDLLTRRLGTRPPTPERASAAPDGPLGHGLVGWIRMESLRSGKIRLSVGKGNGRYRMNPRVAPSRRPNSSKRIHARRNWYQTADHPASTPHHSGSLGALGV